jgi:hemolysin III
VPIKINKAERVSCYSHLAGAIAAFIGTVMLLSVTWGRWNYFAVCLIYGLAVITLFTLSTIYHAFKQRDDGAGIWRKLDHVAIFIMIAGTYTPVVYIYIEGAWCWSIIIIQWVLVIIGVLFKFLFIRAPRIVSTILYLIMGWMAIVLVQKVWTVMSPLSFILVLSGGIAFTIGALIYALKRPNPLPGVFGFHEIFHFFILFGGILHFLVVFLAVTKPAAL